MKWRLDMAREPLFTFIFCVYNRPNFTRLALEAIMGQTYKNLEIIIVNNGGTPEVVEYVLKAQASDNRIKILHHKENQFSLDDHALIYRVCISPALMTATGEYVYLHFDDDLLSNDYAEKMVALFLGNPDCTSAAGLPKRINATGEIISPEARTNNYRPRYMPGHLLVLSTFCTNSRFLYGIMFSAPGVIFSFHRETLIKAGGYNVCIEQSQLYGIVPFGVTGYDETAIAYCRIHAGRTSAYLNRLGWTSSRYIVNFVKDWQIEERWKVFGEDVAKYVVENIVNNTFEDDTLWFVVNFYFFRFKACVYAFRMMWFRSYFWKRLPVLLWIEKRQFKYFMKPHIRRIFESQVWLQKVPALSWLKEKAFK
ncbi:MAG: glycosyltransferase family 2 protein [Candidatus Omnitrophica bacterium]|nr:glycosyltransferase family 2 protein [Candidatus Omnitrophota bacterium]